MTYMVTWFVDTRNGSFSNIWSSSYLVRWSYFDLPVYHSSLVVLYWLDSTMLLFPFLLRQFHGESSPYPVLTFTPYTYTSYDHSFTLPTSMVCTSTPYDYLSVYPSSKFWSRNPHTSSSMNTLWVRLHSSTHTRTSSLLVRPHPYFLCTCMSTKYFGTFTYSNRCLLYISFFSPSRFWPGIYRGYKSLSLPSLVVPGRSLNSGPVSLPPLVPHPHGTFRYLFCQSSYDRLSVQSTPGMSQATLPTYLKWSLESFLSKSPCDPVFGPTSPGLFSSVVQKKSTSPSSLLGHSTSIKTHWTPGPLMSIFRLRSRILWVISWGMVRLPKKHLVRPISPSLLNFPSTLRLPRPHS